jgi:hypothetical protein
MAGLNSIMRMRYRLFEVILYIFLRFSLVTTTPGVSFIDYKLVVNYFQAVWLCGILIVIIAFVTF